MSKTKAANLKRLHELVSDYRELETLLGYSRSQAFRKYNGEVALSNMMLEVIELKKGKHKTHKLVKRRA